MRREKMRTEQPVSRIDWPRTPLRTRLAHRLMIRFDQTSSRLVRQPSAASWPGSASQRLARSAGSFWRSASIVAMSSPRAAANPASKAALWPRLCFIVTTRSHGSRPLASASIAGVRSLLPSSTRITSYGRPIWLRDASTRRSSSATFSSSL